MLKSRHPRLARATAVVLCGLTLMLAAACSAPAPRASSAPEVPSVREAPSAAGTAPGRKATLPARTQAHHLMSPAAVTGGVDVAGPSGFAACERRIAGPGRAVLAVVGASFTAGTGPDRPGLSWAVRLAGMLGWNAVVLGDPGAGYARPGFGHEGPARRLIEREHLAALRPALVIVQFGHDDIGVPAAVERRQVRDTIGLIRAQAPQARIALVTVFTAGRASAAATAVDRVIVSSATAADPDVIIGDPLRQRWVFGHAVRGGLHPSAAGDEQIASIMDRLLRAHGVRPVASARPTPSAQAAPLVCDGTVSPRTGDRSRPRRATA